MLPAEVRNTARGLIDARIGERSPTLRNEVGRATCEALERGILVSTIYGSQVLTLCVAELKARVQIAWEQLRRVLTDLDVRHSDGLADDLRCELEYWADCELRRVQSIYEQSAARKVPTDKSCWIQARASALAPAHAEARLYAQTLRSRAMAAPMAQPALASGCDNDSVITVLFLAANPTDTDRLRLGEEVREIQERIRRATHGSRFSLQSQWAVRVSDLQETLLRAKPAVVHFAGHSGAGGLVLEDRSGNACVVSADALETLFRTLGEGVKCILLNACFTEEQARAMARHIPCVIGMAEAICDRAAISFAWSFYQALAFGKTIGAAFDLGLTQMRLDGLGDGHIPRLFTQEGVDATNVGLV